MGPSADGWSSFATCGTSTSARVRTAVSASWRPPSTRRSPRRGPGAASSSTPQVAVWLPTKIIPPASGRKRHPGPRTCPNTSPSRVDIFPLRIKGFIRSINPTAAATTGRSASPERPYKSENAAIEIQDQDAISDSGTEIWNLLESRGITNVILTGVHTNMCVTGRPFGLRNMARYGKNVVLIRDLTDTMYNSRKWPYVSHFEGTKRIIEHIEKFICATIASTDLTGEPTFRFPPDDRPRAVFIDRRGRIQDRTDPAGFRRQGARAFGDSLHVRDRRSQDAARLPGHRGAQRCGLAGRERPPPCPTADQMAIVRKYIDAGKPVVGIRTACHAFDTKGKAPAGHAEWKTFDPDVLGGHYTTHYSPQLTTSVTHPPDKQDHPILQGIKVPFDSHCSLYKVSPLAASTQTLLVGTVPDQKPEPVAWINRKGTARIFFTSIGAPPDFESPEFRRLLKNAVFWALDRPPSTAANRQRQSSVPVPVPAATRAATAKETHSPFDRGQGPLPPARPWPHSRSPATFSSSWCWPSPIVRQPVSISFDERGRLWVVQYSAVSQSGGVEDDQPRRPVWRAVYDKVPAAATAPLPRQGSRSRSTKIPTATASSTGTRRSWTA